MSYLVQWPMARYWHRAWNPVIGCKPVSPACEHCWARGWADRFKRDFAPFEGGAKTPPRKGVVFVGNMTDMWGEWNLVHEFGGYFHKSCDWIAETLGHNPKNPYKDKAVYLWLTKRAATMAEWVADGGWETWRCLDEADCIDFKDCDMSNQFFGVTAENQEWYDRRQKESMGLPTWANMWYSLEPLLGPIELWAGLVRSNLRWVVVGCESGPNRRPCGLGWVESVVAQCLSAGVPVFVKQLDIGGKCVTDINQFPKDLRIRQVPWKQKGATP